jgi:hypothetical protein
MMFPLLIIMTRSDMPATSEKSDDIKSMAFPFDIIFFDWQGDGHSEHVGIVEYVSGEVVHTVEGNTSNSVARRSYRLDSGSICGFGAPLY